MKHSFKPDCPWPTVWSYPVGFRYLFAISYMDGIHADFEQLTSWMMFKSVQDFQVYVKRLKALPQRVCIGLQNACNFIVINLNFPQTVIEICSQKFKSIVVHYCSAGKVKVPNKSLICLICFFCAPTIHWLLVCAPTNQFVHQQINHQWIIGLFICAPTNHWFVYLCTNKSFVCLFVHQQISSLQSRGPPMIYLFCALTNHWRLLVCAPTNRFGHQQINHQQIIYLFICAPTNHWLLVCAPTNHWLVCIRDGFRGGGMGVATPSWVLQNFILTCKVLKQKSLG